MLMATCRAFIAVNIPPLPSLHRLNGHLTRLGRGVKPVPPALMHLTLRFIGDMDEQLTEPVLGAIRSAAAETSPLTLYLHGLGAFPGRQRPSVIWAGIAPPEPVTELAGAIARGLEPLGLPPERRPFTPHLTVARVRSRPPAALGALMDRFAGQSWGEVRITAIDLMKSTLTPRGPVYQSLGQVPLKRP